jgi:hypothetical protein
VTEGAARDAAAELGVLLVPVGVGLALVDDEDSDHDTASSLGSELSV